MNGNRFSSLAIGAACLMASSAAGQTTTVVFVNARVPHPFRRKGWGTDSRTGRVSQNRPSPTLRCAKNGAPSDQLIHCAIDN